MTELQTTPLPQGADRLVLVTLTLLTESSSPVQTRDLCSVL
jgi:hypothetical protein